MKRYVVAIDLGGHYTFVGLFSEKRMVKYRVFSTPKTKQKILNEIFEQIESFGVKKSEIKGIGFGCPGQVRNGIVINLTNLEGWEGTNLKGVIEKKFRKNIKFKLLNDADAAAIAESIYWNCKDLVCITLGTGFGSGVIKNGKLIEGIEFGHVSINLNGPKCSCGSRGCIEEYVSVRALERMSKVEFGKKMDPFEIESLARKGNQKAKKVYENFGRYLGIGLKNIVNIFNPEIIVIGGGLSNAYDLFLHKAKEELKNALYTRTKVVVSRLKKRAGVYGLASLL